MRRVGIFTINFYLFHILTFCFPKRKYIKKCALTTIIIWMAAALSTSSCLVSPGFIWRSSGLISIARHRQFTQRLIFGKLLAAIAARGGSG
jgi:hypothetical protein